MALFWLLENQNFKIFLDTSLLLVLLSSTLILKLYTRNQKIFLAAPSAPLGLFMAVLRPSLAQEALTYNSRDQHFSKFFRAQLEFWFVSQVLHFGTSKSNYGQIFLAPPTIVVNVGTNLASQ